MEYLKLFLAKVGLHMVRHTTQELLEWWHVVLQANEHHAAEDFRSDRAQSNVVFFQTAAVISLASGDACALTVERKRP